MTAIHENSAGVIPFRRTEDRGRLYLVLHSATVRNPRAKWEFPKGGMETGESTRKTAAREFQEETGLVDWSFREGFERNLFRVALEERHRFGVPDIAALEQRREELHFIRRAQEPQLARLPGIDEPVSMRPFEQGLGGNRRNGTAQLPALEE